MSKPDSTTAKKKQDDMSKIDGILKDMTNDVEEGENLLDRSSATCQSLILFSCTSIKAYGNLIFLPFR